MFTRLPLLTFAFVQRCAAGRGRGLQPRQPMPNYNVQAVSNKLLNLIKRSGIILRSPEGAWTSAVMNTLCLTTTPWFFGRHSGNNLLGNQVGSRGDTCPNGALMGLECVPGLVFRDFYQ